MFAELNDVKLSECLCYVTGVCVCVCVLEREREKTDVLPTRKPHNSGKLPARRYRTPNVLPRPAGRRDSTHFRGNFPLPLSPPWEPEPARVGV